MAINSELVAIEATHNLYIQRLAAQYGNEALPFIESMQERITNRINREVGKNLTPNRRQKLLSDIDEIVNEELKGWTGTLRVNNADLGKYEADFQGKTVASMYPAAEAATVAKSVVKSEANNTLIKLGDDSYTSYNQMLSNYTRQNAEQINNIVAQGFVSGQTTRDIANQVLSEVDNRIVKTKKQAKAVARTGTNHYANVARKVYFDNEPIVIGTRRIATLDSATSQFCFAGETSFLPIGDLTSIYRAKYSGEIITLDFSTGDKLAGTPNHPILTQYGWTPLGEIDPSKHIVYTVERNIFGFMSKKNVNAPTTFSKLFDSLSKSPVVDVKSTDSTAVDFYGDGVRMNGKINILSPKGHLWSDFKSVIGEHIVDNLFGFGHGCSSLSGEGNLFNRGLVWLPSIKASKLTARIVELLKNPGLRSSKFSFNFTRSKSIVKHLDSLFSMLNNKVVALSTLPSAHESSILKKLSDGRSCDIILSSDGCGARTFTVKPVNIVSMSSEFRDCHVYTSSCGQGYYMAGSAIVKNCRSIDNTVVLKTDPNYRSAFSPFHPNCRTANIPELDSRYTHEDEGGERPENFRDAESGYLMPDTTSSKKIFYEAFRSLDAATQDQQLGPTLGRAFRKGLRDGTITPESFAKMTVDEKNLRPLTLKEMEKKDNALGRILREQKR
jgi:hypothetical protein